jgi:heme exporter protein C
MGLVFDMRRLYALASPPRFYQWSGAWLRPLGAIAIAILSVGALWGLLFAPADATQGNSYRIIFAHVPLSFVSLSNYFLMSMSAAAFLIWRARLAMATMYAAAQIGTGFCLLVLLTGAIWAKPTWGAWWAWDARLSSMLVLFFIHVAILALRQGYGSSVIAAPAVAILALIGSIDAVIVHYSVDWWYSLHQPASISLTRAPSISPEMWHPLLLSIVGMYLYYAWVLLSWTRYETLRTAIGARWTQQLK